VVKEYILKWLFIALSISAKRLTQFGLGNIYLSLI